MGGGRGGGALGGEKGGEGKEVVGEEGKGDNANEACTSLIHSHHDAGIHGRPSIEGMEHLGDDAEGDKPHQRL